MYLLIFIINKYEMIHTDVSCLKVRIQGQVWSILNSDQYLNHQNYLLNYEIGYSKT